ncbi:MAG: Clp protease N-terminal domain-containing protein [Dysosmobacter welbionis]
MNENKFSPRAEEALRLSQEAAGELGHGYVGTEHLLLGLIREEEGVAHTVLTEAGLTDDMIVEIIKKSVGAGLPGSNPAQGLTPAPSGWWSWPWRTPCGAATTTWARSTCWRASCGKATIWPSASCAPLAWMPVTCTQP